MSDNNQMNDEDYLRRHLEDLEQNKRSQEEPVVHSDIPFAAKESYAENTKVSDLQFFNFDIKELPCGQFYPQGSVIMIRPAQVREIQAYSMVDDNNFYDIVEKMNDMLQSCIRIKYSDGKIGSYSRFNFIICELCIYTTTKWANWFS